MFAENPVIANLSQEIGRAKTPPESLKSFLGKGFSPELKGGLPEYISCKHCQ